MKYSQLVPSYIFFSKNEDNLVAKEKWVLFAYNRDQTHFSSKM